MHSFDRAYHWVLNVKDLAAWLQAFAALVALVLSSLSLIGPAISARKRRNAEAFAIAIAISPALIGISEKAAADRKLIAQWNNRDIDVSSFYAIKIINSFAIVMPPLLDRYIDRLHILRGRSGLDALSVIAMFNEYNRYFQNIGNDLSNTQIVSTKIFVNQTDAILEQLEYLTRNSYLDVANKNLKVSLRVRIPRLLGQIPGLSRFPAFDRRRNRSVAWPPAHS